MVGGYLDLDQPERLLWLLLLPLLYLLARPPRPRRARLTAHLRQWLQARDTLKRRPLRFRRLRFLLLVLAFLAMVLAHAGSRVAGRAGAAELVVLVDTSASLGARSSGGPPAWQELRQHLREQLATVPEHIPVRVGLCGAELTLRRGREAAALADTMPQGVLAVDMATLAAQLQQQDPDRRLAVWSLTDGRGPHARVATGAVTVVGTPLDNVGIVAVTVADAWPLPEIAVTTTVQNLGQQAATVQLAVTGGVMPLPARELQLLPRQQQVVELALRRAGGGDLRLDLLDHRDALAVDDQVVIHVPAPPAPEIAVYSDTEDNRMLDAAAKALAAESGGRVVDSVGATKAGFLLVDGGAMPTLRPGVRALTFGTWLRAGRAGADDTVQAPAIVDWDRQDPITKGLDLSGLRVDRCLRRGFSLAGHSLLRGAQQDLIVVAETAESASVHAAFRLVDSNFALLAAFPQFLRRCYVRAYGRQAEARVAEDSLLDANESDLSAADRPVVRPLPVFRTPATPLAVPLLLLALLLLAVRIYV